MEVLNFSGIILGRDPESGDIKVTLDGLVMNLLSFDYLKVQMFFPSPRLRKAFWEREGLSSLWWFLFWGE